MSFILNNKQIVEWKSTNPPWQHTHAHHEFMLSSFPRNNDIKQNFPALEPCFVLILLVNKIRVDLADYDCIAYTHTHTHT